jgi:hypothetical protein
MKLQSEVKAIEELILAQQPPNKISIDKPGVHIPIRFH